MDEKFYLYALRSLWLMFMCFLSLQKAPKRPMIVDSCAHFPSWLVSSKHVCSCCWEIYCNLNHFSRFHRMRDSSMTCNRCKLEPHNRIASYTKITSLYPKICYIGNYWHYSYSKTIFHLLCYKQYFVIQSISKKRSKRLNLFNYYLFQLAVPPCNESNPISAFSRWKWCIVALSNQPINLKQCWCWCQLGCLASWLLIISFLYQHELIICQVH